MSSAGLAMAVARLVGQRTWGGRIGVGSFLQVEIGPPAARGPGERRDHGAYHLWLYGCAWDIRDGDRVVATSDDAVERMSRGAALLSGTRIVEARLNGPLVELVLQSGVVLASLPSEDDAPADAEDALPAWFLYTPSGVVTMHADGTVTTGGG